MAAPATSLRPLLHFTAPQNWLNDPNGLIYLDGEYHLFYQHNPHGLEWGNMSWGHAISLDLLAWNHLPIALLPDELGTMFSGSAVIDHNNTAGFGRGAMVLIYTAAGGTSPASRGRKFSQCLAYSTDRGRTFTKYEGNPVLPALPEDVNGNRDPKVFWHAPTSLWIMALYVGVGAAERLLNEKPVKLDAIYLFTSPDLKSWTYASALPGFFECPDLFELPIHGEPGATRWILNGANGEYHIGRFDGTVFHRESGFHRFDYGKNFFASQTYSNISKEDGRSILIAWMRGGRYPDMPFNQQMSIPTACTLRRTPLGLRVHRYPVHELESWRQSPLTWAGPIADKSARWTAPACGPCDIEVELDLRTATEASLRLYGQRVTFLPLRMSSDGGDVELPDCPRQVELRIIVDHTSIEVFINQGREVISWCYLPLPDSPAIEFTAQDGNAYVNRLTIHPLRARPVAEK